DGKTARHSHDQSKGLGALHSVSVWASEYGLNLGQVAMEEKSNEITAIPGLLKLLDIRGAIITIDAMGCQTEIAAQIVDGQADYVLALKGFARAVRAQWGIENTCHWSLDITYREDESRIREAHVRENFAWLNRFTLSLLKQHPDKDSLMMKRRCCGGNSDFLLQVLTGTVS
ncbi:MAG: ISAs1 family transposase, partial [Planctomycetaceae bacterium]|nr:ISAs1 family transposase [Planctomycetaceae bacterium]